jgi:SAM-dependent methyltransferase
MIRLRDRPRLRRPSEPGPRAAGGASFGTTAFARDLAPAPLAVDRPCVTQLLYERLSDDDVAAIERKMAESAGPQGRAVPSNDQATHPFFLLAYGLWLGVPSISEKTGLSRAQPPEEIHAMARGPLAAPGGLYEADLVVSALDSVGVKIEDVGRVLDFGCSSGRVVRVLSAAYPELHWTACDPNEPAIGWAKDNLPGIEFYVNAQQPPLPVEQGSLDLVYAISIWSHFAPELGLRWFEEMRRVIRPGGHFVFTTHGAQSVAFFADAGFRQAEQADEILRALYSRGWWYAAEFDDERDWGVVYPDWGTTFLNPEWILTKLCPRWRVLEFAPGRNLENQDVYVLERAQ